ncbi:hypothetical protein BKA64DRAFT_738255 [Cadophora sp. MPI-SDFR-AT-0126]|nr:hypothetical protein BKA64DRAFT_738255 [Leotiomycetes sp. MPI-SDFR-AT-0126]
MDEERAEVVVSSASPTLRAPKTPKEILDDVPDGIPKTGAFLSLDPDMSTLIVRRFHQLSTRNLLFLEGRVAALQKLQRNLDQTQKEERDVIDADKSWEEFALLGTGRGARGGMRIPAIAFAEWAISREKRKSGTLPGKESEPFQQAKSLRFVRILLQSIEELGVQDQEMVLGVARGELQTLRDKLPDKLFLDQPQSEPSLQANLLEVTINWLGKIKPYPFLEKRGISGKSDVLIQAKLSDILKSLLQTIQDSLVVNGSEISQQATLLGVVRNVLQTIQDNFSLKWPEIIGLHERLLKIATDSLLTIHPSERTGDPDFSHHAELLAIAKGLLERIQISFRHLDWPESSLQGPVGVVKRLLQNIQDDLRLKETELSQQAKSLDLAETSLRTIQDKWDVAIAVKDALKEYQEAVLRYRDISSLEPPATRSLETIRKWFNREQPHDLLNVDRAGGPFLRESALNSLFKVDHKETIALHVGADDDPVSKRLSQWEWYTNLAGQDMVQGFRWTPEKWIHDSVTGINLTIAIVFLVGATWSLWGSEHSDHVTVTLAVLTTWVIIFAAWIGLLTNANRGEVFAATAAYAAVLVVFVGTG